MIELVNTSLKYDKENAALRDVSFRFEKGSYHYITGPSGAGKTSLIRLLALSHPPFQGMVRFMGHPVNYLDRASLIPLRQIIGVVYQDYRVLPHLTVFENVALPLRIQRRSNKEIRNNVEELLHWVGLGEHMHAYPLTISGGEQQRVSIARSVVTQPRLLLADEPTGNLDDAVAQKIMSLFEQLYKMGTTIVVATHNQDLITRYSHPELRLNKGKLEKVAPAYLKLGER